MAHIAPKIKISIVSYTNTLPFRWALKRSRLLQEADLQEDMPSDCARRLLKREVDLALVPVAIIPDLGEYHIQSGYCIGADGVVDSVKLYSEVPLGEMEEVLLDYQSRTSVILARVLLERHWKRKVKLTPARPGFESSFGGTTAAVVIGDRTFAMNGRYRFEFDLAGEWKKMTGLPFVFAAWISRVPLPDNFVRDFDAALGHGVANIAKAVEEEPIAPAITKTQALEYLRERIDYRLDKPKHKALALFLEYLKAL